MSGEGINLLIALVTVGVALAGLILTSNRGLRQDMAQLRQEMRQDVAQLEARLQEDIARLRQEMREDMKQLAERVARLEHGQARLEGLLEGLREAITGRAAAR